jgi:precorrin-6B methylase 2
MNVYKIENLRREFSKNHPINDDVWLNTDKKDIKKILKALSPNEGDKALYIGVGSGFGTYLASEFVGQSGEVISYEVDPEVLRNAKKNLGYVDAKKNINLIIGDGTSQPHKKEYFDKVFLACGGPSELPLYNKQTIMKKDLNEKSLLKHLSDQTKPNGIIVLPMGKLTSRWDPTCLGEVYRIKNYKNVLKVSKIGEDELWTPLVGEHGFSKKQINESLKNCWEIEDFIID